MNKLRPPPLYVFPEKKPSSDRPSNVLPTMLARFLRDRIGGEVSADIVQVTGRRRTSLNRLVRLLFQPRFRGRVIAGRAYILVDDVVSSGALFASLRSHIIRGGGIVVGITALAHVSGRDQQLAITEQSLQAIKIEFSDAISPFWQAKFGHRIEQLTEQEAMYLLGRWRSQHYTVPSGYGLLQCLTQEIEVLEAIHVRSSE